MGAVHRVTLIPGDGIGPEVALAARRVVDASGAQIDWHVEEAGEAQQQSVLDGLYTLDNVVPGVCFVLVGLVLWFLYPLKKGVIAKNVAILAARRAGTWVEGDPLPPRDAHVS